MVSFCHGEVIKGLVWSAGGDGGRCDLTSGYESRAFAWMDLGRGWSTQIPGSQYSQVKPLNGCKIDTAFTIRNELETWANRVFPSFIVARLNVHKEPRPRSVLRPSVRSSQSSRGLTVKQKCQTSESAFLIHFLPFPIGSFSQFVHM